MIELRTERLLLSEMTWGDVPQIHALHCIPEVAAHNIIGIPKHQGDTLAVMLAALEDTEAATRLHYGWLLRCAQHGTFMGEVGLDLCGNDSSCAELHYSLLPDVWNQGYGSEAVECLLAFGFQHCRLQRVEALVATENPRSIRVLEKVGLMRKGLHQKARSDADEFREYYQYALSAEEWEKLKKEGMKKPG